MARIEVFENESDTRRQHWTFSTRTKIGGGDEVEIYLDSFTVDERESTRHKWRATRGWYRQDERSYYSQIARNDVAVPDWVVEEAKSRVVITYAPLEPQPASERRY